MFIVFVFYVCFIIGYSYSYKWFHLLIVAWFFLHFVFLLVWSFFFTMNFFFIVLLLNNSNISDVFFLWFRFCIFFHLYTHCFYRFDKWLMGLKAILFLEFLVFSVLLCAYDVNILLASATLISAWTSLSLSLGCGWCVCGQCNTVVKLIFTEFVYIQNIGYTFEKV